jgi:hypothetical protein
MTSDIKGLDIVTEVLHMRLTLILSCRGCLSKNGIISPNFETGAAETEFI